MIEQAEQTRKLLNDIYYILECISQGIKADSKLVLLEISEDSGTPVLPDKFKNQAKREAKKALDYLGFDGEPGRAAEILLKLHKSIVFSII